MKTLHYTHLAACHNLEVMKKEKKELFRKPAEGTNDICCIVLFTGDRQDDVMTLFERIPKDASFMKTLGMTHKQYFI